MWTGGLPRGQRRRAERQRNDRQRAKQRPWRHGPFDVRRHAEQEQMGNQGQPQAVSDALRHILCCSRGAAGLAQRPQVSANHDQRESDDDQQRRQQADRGCRFTPPRQQDEPRNQAACQRQRRQFGSGAFDEERGVENGQQEGQTPDAGDGNRPDRQIHQQRQAQDQHDSAAGFGQQRLPSPSRELRHAEVQRREGGIGHQGLGQRCRGQVLRRPHGFGREREECGDEIQDGRSRPRRCARRSRRRAETAPGRSTPAMTLAARGRRAAGTRRAAAARRGWRARRRPANSSSNRAAITGAARYNAMKSATNPITGIAAPGKYEFAIHSMKTSSVVPAPMAWRISRDCAIATASRPAEIRNIQPNSSA